jgi:hypothetical protein
MTDAVVNSFENLNNTGKRKQAKPHSAEIPAGAMV